MLGKTSCHTGFRPQLALEPPQEFREEVIFYTSRGSKDPHLGDRDGGCQERSPDTLERWLPKDAFSVRGRGQGLNQGIQESHLSRARLRSMYFLQGSPRLTGPHRASPGTSQAGEATRHAHGASARTVMGPRARRLFVARRVRSRVDVTTTCWGGRLPAPSERHSSSWLDSEESWTWNIGDMDDHEIRLPNRWCPPRNCGGSECQGVMSPFIAAP